MGQKELVRAAKTGDAAAFTELYKELYRDMYHFAYYMVRHTEDAKDAVSEAVLDAWAALGTLKNDGSFKNWIFAILSNKCRAKLRAYVDRPVELTETTVGALNAPQGVTTPEQLQIREEFLKLPETDRLMIGLHLFAGYKTKEIAQALHMNANTVRSRERRALKRLAEAMKEA